ncbi:AraC family transcriptional regulator [Paenibacillus algorifonticola]|uniref:helix-turn-helix domain-containing protein n=1 Tax=Paenibacillus algorifonticola TaxID=684063 RepID=UPI003D2C6FDB
MLRVMGVFFDDFIQTWRSREAILPMYVLVLVTQGKVIYHLNEQPYVAGKGEMLIIPKGTLRGAENDESGPHQKFTVLFDYEQNNPQYIPVLDRNTVYQMRIRHFDYLTTRFEQLYREQKGADSIDQLITLNGLQEILLLVSREAELVNISPIKLTLAKKIENYLVANFRQPVEIDDLADLISRSHNYTSSIFKNVTGQSPIQFMHQLRIAEARRLLLHTDMGLSDISQYLGYYDTSYFYRMFKKIMGTTPTEFRARNVGVQQQLRG